MAGSLTLAGMADGLLIGQVTVGPNTMTGAESISEVINCELATNVDFVVKVPTNARAFACMFTFGGEAPPELKLGSNLSATSTGFVTTAQGFLALPLTTGVTELKFKAPSPPPVFQLVFI